jgi:hypothetical protein
MASSGAARIFELVATVVRVVCAVIGALILVHAAFVLFEANRDNTLVELTESVRDTFAWFTRDLFTKPDARIAEVIDDALAAIIYVVVGNVVSKLIVRLAPASKAKA